MGFAIQTKHDMSSGILNEQFHAQQISPHCRVLPPGKFNSMILIPLTIYPENFTTMAVTVPDSHTVVTSQHKTNK